MLTHLDLIPASHALQNWFKSQDLGPAEAAMVTEIFYAKLIIANSTSKAEAEVKVDFIVSSIKVLIAIFQKEMPDAR